MNILAFVICKRVRGIILFDNISGKDVSGLLDKFRNFRFLRFERHSASKAVILFS